MDERTSKQHLKGFASMDKTRQREIASKGGRAAHAKGRAHEWNSEEAQAAGRKGGVASHKNRESQSDSKVQATDSSGSK